MQYAANRSAGATPRLCLRGERDRSDTAAFCTLYDGPGLYSSVGTPTGTHETPGFNR
jgi:hypothetical protein